MIFFIIVLRVLATCLITNAHYTGIYPIDLIANGGLLGDIIFFAISGYCLYEVKENFFKWYYKRLIRIYIPTIIITCIYILIGAYSITKDQNLFSWLIYPTKYHFIASIIILYIPYYFIMRFNKLRNNILVIMSIIILIYFLLYLFEYDKSYYHIDNVREIYIRFLFILSMLLGAWFKHNDLRFRNKENKNNIFWVLILLVLYVISKVYFQKYEIVIAEYQIINQIVIFLLLFYIIKFFLSVDYKLEKLPVKLKKIIECISKLTLEIYLVQYIIIDYIRGKFIFPINWIVLTISIIVIAYLLHLVSEFIIKKIRK